MSTVARLRFVLLVSVVAVLFASAAFASTGLRVMTYNVDEGTDFKALIGVLANPNATQQDFAAAVQQTIGEVVASNPALRMQLIAQQIATAQPDLVGLQEAAVWTAPGIPGGQLDLLQLILAALPNYQAVVIAPEFQINLTTLGVGFTDRDIILVRSDLVGAVTRTRQGHYHVFIPLSSPYLPGTTGITRGWAYADLSLNGTNFRFITTHLEDGTNTLSPLFAWVQAFQEIELIYSPALTSKPEIIGGDFNTVANDPTNPTNLAYRFMLANGFTDAWTKGHSTFSGATCCQEDLTSAVSTLTQRIDLVFTRNHIKVMGSQLVGDSLQTIGLDSSWPSDHAGVVADLQIGATF